MRKTLRRWLDPSDGGTLGSEPDYRFSLANERTFLAWIRTALALVAGGLAVAAVVPPLRWPWLREALAVALLLLGASVGLRAINRWSAAERAMRLQAPLPPSRFPALLALVSTVGASVLLVLVVGSAVRP